MILFFFNDTATTDISPLSLPAALQIYSIGQITRTNGLKLTRVGGVNWNGDLLAEARRRGRRVVGHRVAEP